MFKLLWKVDNAVDLFTIDGFSEVLRQLNSSDASLREEAAHVIGSAVQSNPTAQIKVKTSKTNLVPK